MDFENKTTIIRDIIGIIGCGIGLQMIKFLIHKKLYYKISQNIFHITDKSQEYNFTKQFWGLTWHASQLILMLIFLIPTNYFKSIINPFKYGVSSQWEYNDNDLTLGIRFIFWIQIGYYTFDMFKVLCFDSPSDKYMMATHHIAALILLWLSYLPTFGKPNYAWKMGTAILIIHEITDLTLYLCKTLHYIKYDTIANALFVLNILAWIIFRLIYNIPLSLSALYGDFKSRWQSIPAIILLFTLYCMQVYWIFLMSKVLFTAVFSDKKLEDPRDIATNELKNHEIELESDKMNKNITDNSDDSTDIQIDDNIQQKIDNYMPDNNIPIMRRRSSLMGSFIQENNNILQ